MEAAAAAAAAAAQRAVAAGMEDTEEEKAMRVKRMEAIRKVRLLPGGIACIAR